MRIPTVIVVLLLAAVSIFALLNWGAIVTPMTLSFGFATVQAPLGLVMLVALGLVTAAFLMYVIYQQAVWLVEARRFSRDLHAQRKLADEAEASRFTELRAHLDARLARLEELLGQRRPER